jgi:hypothetical protein
MQCQELEMYKCTNEECKKFDIAVSVQEAMVGERGYLCVWCVKPMKQVDSPPTEQVPDKIAIDDNEESGGGGYDKVEELDQFLSAVQRHHPHAAAQYPGQELNRNVLKLYSTNAFRDSRRPREGIRDARAVMKKIESDAPLVGKFLKGSILVSEFVEASKSHRKDRRTEVGNEAESNLVDLCKKINSILTDVDAQNLSAAERRTLKRTSELISQVLEEIKS